MPVQDRRAAILELMKSIYFVKPMGQNSYRHSFLTALAVLEFWETDATRQLTRKLAKQAKLETVRLGQGDRQTFAALLMDTIKANLFEPAFFRLPFPPSGTVSDCISASDKDNFADRYWATFLTAADRTIETWLSVHPVPKVKLMIPSVQFGSVRMVASGDHATWRGLQARFPGLQRLDPNTGTFHTEASGVTFNVLPETWLVSENAGTSEAARIQASREMSILVALIFANSSKPGRFLKSAADPVHRVVQVSEDKGRETSFSFTHMPEILPPILGTLSFDAATEPSVAAWYAKRAAATPANAARASTAAAFYHHGIIADDLEKFVHLFVVLDALFGVPFGVKKQLKIGTQKVFPGDRSWVDRALLLYDLRNDIVHGSISALADWSEDDNYFATYGSSATEDVITLATKALVRFFDLPH